MAGVDADAEPLRVGHAVEDIAARCSKRWPRQVPCPAVVSRSIVTPRPAVRRMDLVEGPRDPRQAGLLALADVGAGMDDQVGDAQRLAALDLDGHRVDRLLPERVVGTAQVDQVRGVGDRVDDSGLGEGRAEGRDVLGRSAAGRSTGCCSW